MISVIIVIQLMLVVAQIGVVLLQKSEGGGLVSSTSGFMTGRGTADNVLTRTTALLAAGFFLTSLALSWLAGFDRKPASIINPGGGGQEAPISAPTTPLNSGSGGILNQLQGGGPAAPGSAPAPSGPQAPDSK